MLIRSHSTGLDRGFPEEYYGKPWTIWSFFKSDRLINGLGRRRNGIGHEFFNFFLPFPGGSAAASCPFPPILRDRVRTFNLNTKTQLGPTVPGGAI